MALDPARGSPPGAWGPGCWPSRTPTGNHLPYVRSARRPDGTWLQERRHPGRVWFEVDVPAGEPSPWLTFHATRVLVWWDAATGPGR